MKSHSGHMVKDLGKDLPFKERLLMNQVKSTVSLDQPASCFISVGSKQLVPRPGDLTICLVISDK